MKKDQSSLCCELILPGIGYKNYLLSIIVIFLIILRTYTFISPVTKDYDLEITLIIGVIYIINFIIKYFRSTDVDQEIKELIFALIIPGLDIFIYKSKIFGSIVMSLFFYFLSINTFLSLVFSIIYIFLYKKVYKYKKLAILLIISFLVIDLPEIYLITVKNQPVKIVSGSMEPTLKIGKRYLMNITDEIKIGDIGVFEPNKVYPNAFTKRIVGFEGDKIFFSKHNIYINGVKIIGIKYSAKGNLMEKKEIIVSKNKVYVLGDNTDNSYDSREFGMIDKKYLYGKIVKGLGSKNVLKDTWKKNNFLK